MADIRCGIATGPPDLLARLQPFGINAMPITGSAAANVSLLQPDLVPTRKKIIADTCNTTFAFLDAHGYKYIPSHSNCFMIDTGRPGKGVFVAMQEKNVYIGRTWPVWPNHVRISVGPPAEMARFQTAFKEVMDAPPPRRPRRTRPLRQPTLPAAFLKHKGPGNPPPGPFHSQERSRPPAPPSDSPAWPASPSR
jgi:histidinol-phosphate aminotransferase